MRFTTDGGVAMWEFEKVGHPVNVRVAGQLIFNNIAPARLGALNGSGPAYLPEDYVQPQIALGKLVRVLGR